MAEMNSENIVNDIKLTLADDEDRIIERMSDCIKITVQLSHDLKRIPIVEDPYAVLNDTFRMLTPDQITHTDQSINDRVKLAAQRLFNACD